MSARGEKKKTPKLSHSKKAGVIFPVGRMRSYMRRGPRKYRIGVGAPVYLAAVIGYLVGEILELAGNIAKDNIKRRITPRHILIAVECDHEIKQVLKGVTIPSRGFLPRIFLNWPRRSFTNPTGFLRFRKVPSARPMDLLPPSAVGI